MRRQGLGRAHLTASAVAILTLACGPKAGDDDAPPGELVYEAPYESVYRLDRRIDVVMRQEHGERRECGFLTDRALNELESTIDALDPGVDYGYDADLVDCDYEPMAWVHLDGFEHSPFQCSWMCCRSELLGAAFIYAMVIHTFHGGTPNIEGEPFDVIEPDQPCP
jgi:hypothetical protein